MITRAVMLAVVLLLIPVEDVSAQVVMGGWNDFVRGMATVSVL